MDERLVEAVTKSIESANTVNKRLVIMLVAAILITNAAWAVAMSVFTYNYFNTDYTWETTNTNENYNENVNKEINE